MYSVIANKADIVKVTRTMYRFYVICSVLSLVNIVQADICDRTPRDTAATKTPGDNGFRIKLAGRPPPEKYTPDHVYTVSVNGTYPNQYLLDFMLVAVPLNARDESTTMGTFQVLDDGFTRHAYECPYVITQAGRRRRHGVNVLWTAPPAGSGCIEFRATVVEYPDIWYKDDGALTRVFCEETGKTENERAPELIPECCACGSAKYTVTFHGTWSRQSHPKDYPTHKRLLHWSNIVGATHNKDYMIWKYNDYATKGIKEVCEFGYTSTLEEEMRQRSSDVRTVVKTTGIWWKDPEGLRQNRMARFSVDKRKHLLSMLSMLGPSPDWCVGVSALDLCLPNCTWAGDQSIDLFPWDAGTDDGLTYMAPNSPSNPQQRIHRITSNFPDNSQSPFFENDPLRPLARLEIRRISPKPGQPLVCTDDEEDYDDIELDFGDSALSDMEMKKKMMMMSGKCAVSDWLDWSGCSVTCGVGMRVRNREFLMPGIDETMCPGIELMQKENCIGVENTCEDPDDPCSVTDWSEWSPCTVTCGSGDRERRRQYMRSEYADDPACQRQLGDQEECVLHGCAVATSKNFTAICSEEQDVGPCRGGFTRWYHDVTMRKCLPFRYGGCRGNNNRFQTEEECTRVCVLSGGDSSIVTATPSDEEAPTTKKPGKRRKNKSENQVEKVDCMATPWSSWTPCSATCGKAFQTRQRLIKRASQGGGKKCPKKLTKKKRCKTSKCPKPLEISEQPTRVKAITHNCVFSDWSAWSACSASCGESFKHRRRRLREGDEEACSNKLQRQAPCNNLPQCSARMAAPCVLGEWSLWSPCPPSTCIQERTRPVMRREERGGTPCGTRIQRRVCIEGPCASYSNYQLRAYN